MALTDIRRPSARPTERAEPRGAVTGSTMPWARSLLVGAALAAALASLHVTLQGVSWWLVGTLAVVVTLATAVTVRSILRGPFWPSLVALGAGVGFVTLGYAADTAILGVIPTLGTLDRLGALSERGILSIIEQRVPATPELGIVMLIAVLMLVCAAFADAVVAAGRPALVALPLAAILVVPVAIKPGLVDVVWFLVTAALYLAVLRIGRPRDSARVVLVVAAVVTVGSLLAPSALPAVDESAANDTGGLRSGLNPLITLGDDLRRGEPMLALSYTTSATRPVYLRLTTLDDFTGETWGPIVGTGPSTGVETLPPPPGLDGDTVRTVAEVSVAVRDVQSSWLPIPYPTQAITGLEGEWFWEPDGLTVRTLVSGAQGQNYTASFFEVAPSDELLAGTVAPFTGFAPEHTLELPGEGVPEIIRDTAHEVGDAAASAFDKALALQSYLRGPEFSYSEQTPVDEGFDGTGLDALAVFLEQKTGYCVHYASAMAVMARELGIPSRIAVGFQPGERRFAEGANVFEVSTDDLHAWPELYFAGAGWLRFEPTPTRGALPRYGDTTVDDPTTPEDESSPAPSAAPTTAPDEQPDADVVDPEAAEAAEAAEQAAALTISGLAILLVVVVLALIPAAFRTGVRMRRVRRIRQGRDAAAAAWDEVRDTTRDVGWSAPETETPRAFALRLAPQLSGGPLGEFRGRVEAAAYGPPDAAGLSPAELAAVRRSILRTAGPRTRLRALLLPVSLLYRWRPEEPAEE